jgi:hypothetical protein
MVRTSMSNLWDYREQVWDYRERTWTLDRDLVRYEVQASDGYVGSIVSVESGPQCAYVVVDTSATFGGSRLVPAGVIASLDHEHAVVHVNLTKDLLRRAPVYAGEAWNDEIRVAHSDYYGPVNR